MRQLHASALFAPAGLPPAPPGGGGAAAARAPLRPAPPRGGRGAPPAAALPLGHLRPRPAARVDSHVQRARSLPLLPTVFYVSAILTGIALVIAGAIQTGAPDASVDPELPAMPAGISEPPGSGPGGDLLVFVYIGVLLIGVNVSLLLLQCYMRSKELRRARRATALQPPSAPPATVHYNPLVSSVGPPRQVALPCAVDIASGMHRLQPPNLSPGKAQRRGYGPASVHSVATVPAAIPSTQPHWLLTPGSRAATVAAAGQPPPSYDNLLVVSHAPRDVATLHLI